MAQDIRKSRIKDILTRLFGSAESAEEVIISAREDTSRTCREELSSDEIPPAQGEVSPAILTISERVAVLKKAFEFEAALKDRLNEISSTRDLLLYLHDVVLFRFTKLHEIGLISSESYEVLGSLNQRLGDVLTKDRALQNDLESSNVEELRRDNLELKQRMEHLHAKYVKNGIITETELSQEKEIRFLQSKVREQHSQLGVARKRLKILASYQDMVQSLRAKNSLLNSKLEHQSRLLRAVTAGNPKQQELVSTVENLTEENRRLRMELEKQSELLNRLKMNLPENIQQVAQDLVARNVSLRSDLEKKEAQLEHAGKDRPSEGAILDSIERLNETNIQLKGSLGAAQLIERYIEDRQKGIGDPNKIIETLTMENQRLELALSVKEEQIQTLSADPVSKKLLKAFSRLQNDYKELYMENRAKGQLYQQELDEKRALMAQARERTELIKENHRLRADLESAKRLADLLRKVELQCQVLKKERSEISSKYKRAVAELEHVNKKLAKVTAEYGLLVKEYENIFTVK
jgi:hypothetical protein